MCSQEQELEGGEGGGGGRGGGRGEGRKRGGGGIYVDGEGEREEEEKKEEKEMGEATQWISFGHLITFGQIGLSFSVLAFAHLSLLYYSCFPSIPHSFLFPSFSSLHPLLLVILFFLDAKHIYMSTKQDFR